MYTITKHALYSHFAYHYTPFIVLTESSDKLHKSLIDEQLINFPAWVAEYIITVSLL